MQSSTSWYLPLGVPFYPVFLLLMLIRKLEQPLLFVCFLIKDPKWERTVGDGTFSLGAFYLCENRWFNCVGYTTTML